MASASLPDHDALLQARPEKMLGEIFYAVCTHGRHDKCCAKFGSRVCRAFRQEVGERAWECSHVGGDRFAGNVVVFPYGIYYGRVGPEDVPDVSYRKPAKCGCPDIGAGRVFGVQNRLATISRARSPEDSASMNSAPSKR